MAVFNALEFKTDHSEPTPIFWGNGHTVETDPTKVWKMKYHTRFKCWMIGKKDDSVGCISIRNLNGILDVAFYYGKPSETFIDGGFNDAIYREYPEGSGVGLEIIQEMKSMLQS